MSTLKIDAITLTFGGLAALSKVNMEIKPGLITSIIGPNGAGKTSLLNCISGFYHPTSGDIFYREKRLTHASPHQVSSLGIARAFQNLELFSGMTVLDNLLLARHQHLKYGFLDAAFFTANGLLSVVMCVLFIAAKIGVSGITTAHDLAGVIDDAEERIRQNLPDFRIEDVSLEDETTYDLLERGDLALMQATALALAAAAVVEKALGGWQQPG